MNYDTPPSRFGVIGVDVIPRGNVHYLHEVRDTSEQSTHFEPFTVTGETTPHDELTAMIHTVAATDVETGDIASLLQPETAVQRALEVYDIYVSDTTLQPETAVAEYLYAFTEAVLDPARTDVTPQDVETIFAGFSTLLQTHDPSESISA